MSDARSSRHSTARLPTDTDPRRSGSSPANVSVTRGCTWTLSISTSSFCVRTAVRRRRARRAPSSSRIFSIGECRSFVTASRMSACRASGAAPADAACRSWSAWPVGWQTISSGVTVHWSREFRWWSARSRRSPESSNCKSCSHRARKSCLTLCGRETSRRLPSRPCCASFVTCSAKASISAPVCAEHSAGKLRKVPLLDLSGLTMSAALSEDLVSVVIATYNMGQYLREAVQSVLAQTYPQRRGADRRRWFNR